MRGFKGKEGGHHRISATGNLRPHDIDGVSALNNPNQKTLTIISYNSDRDFAEFMAKHYDRLRRSGYTFMLISSAQTPSGALALIHALNQTPERVHIICDTLTREKRWIMETETEKNPHTGWETHSGKLNF